MALGPLHPTSVTPSKKGKKVELFAQRTCGCGHHGERFVHAVVGLDGHLVESNEEMLWEDPSKDNLCVD